MKKHTAALLYFGSFLFCLFACTLQVSCGATVDCKDPANAKNIKCVPAEVETALIDCSKAIVTPSTLSDVAQAFAGSDWTKSMEDLGIKYGINVASCAARDVVAVWLSATPAPVASGSGSAAGSGSSAAVQPSTAQPRPEVMRAKQYLADKKFKE